MLFFIKMLVEQFFLIIIIIREFIVLVIIPLPCNRNCENFNDFTEIFLSTAYLV